MYNQAMNEATLGAGMGQQIHLDGDISPTQARALLKLRFSQQDRDRMRELSAKARAGTLTAQEETEIDTYERLGYLLDIVQSKARRVLQKNRSAG
jgi:hypothetical protein